MGFSKFTKILGFALVYLCMSAANTFAVDGKIAPPVNAVRKIASTAPVSKVLRPANSAVPPRVPASVHDDGIDITGQSRNLSMGLMFQRDKDTVSFGSPRTNYKDKITTSQTNY
jgi:hypothetical protein